MPWVDFRKAANARKKALLEKGGKRKAEYTRSLIRLIYDSSRFQEAADAQENRE
jgi:hypothetical protein